ncbi:hypothetical protein [Sphingomonas sp. IC4-52]|uniref:hypothetical protein n=1 Tax=Sphingomonas sp. IC4-52 TaxID=2887202 RepID=UPI001D12173A|nr:hypothetical protein [Sphingomonas sp. IC4-52]MCC2979045.1 hypothetical protein [Sphingomonas sp. IC4-52]
MLSKDDVERNARPPFKSLLFTLASAAPKSGPAAGAHYPTFVGSAIFGCMKRKKLLLAVNAAFGPALVALALNAWNLPRWRWLVARDDGGMHGVLAIMLAVVMVYSLGFQLWLVKLFFEPYLRRAFDAARHR